MPAAALSQKSQSGRISGESASRYTAAPRPMAVSMISRSSPCPTRRAYHSRAGATSSRNAASSPWVSRRSRRRILIGQRVDAAIHVQLAAVQAQLADVQALSADHQHARAGTQHDALVVEALYVLYAGDGELLPPLQL